MPTKKKASNRAVTWQTCNVVSSNMATLRTVNATLNQQIYAKVLACLNDSPANGFHRATGAKRPSKPCWKGRSALFMAQKSIT